MLEALMNFYQEKSEPQRSTFLALREIIMAFSSGITEEWKYKLPFFYFRGKPFCYLWKDKKTQFPYIGFVKSNLIEHPLLLQGTRKKMKILEINPNEDIPIEIIMEILERLSVFY